MTDRELLEFAAKAAGIQYDAEKSKPHPVSGAWWGLWLKYDRERNEFDRCYWNPLRDDGDALRLAVKLNIEFSCFDNQRSVNAGVWEIDGNWDCMTPYNGDKQAAVRRSIVLAASKIEKNMQ